MKGVSDLEETPSAPWQPLQPATRVISGSTSAVLSMASPLSACGEEFVPESQAANAATSARGVIINRNMEFKGFISGFISFYYSEF
jgi:hypothetical protein